MPNLGKAAIEFNQWIYRNLTYHNKRGHLVDNNKALVCFLREDIGCQYVKTYDELCRLADILEQHHDYSTFIPPCSLEEFDAIVKHYDNVMKAASVNQSSEDNALNSKEFDCLHISYG